MDRPGSGLYNAALFHVRRFPADFGAQVAQLVEHAIENRSVGGSIPPLGTKTLFLSKRLSRNKGLILAAIPHGDF